MHVDVAYLRHLLNAVKAHQETTTKNLLGLNSEKEKKGDLVSRMELQKTSIREAFNKKPFFVTNVKSPLTPPPLGVT